MPSIAILSCRAIFSAGVHRLDDRLAVGVQAPVGVPGVGVAPGDAEDLLAAGHEVLDQAALLGEVDHVVLVDRRRHDQQRHLADLGASAACTGSARRRPCAARRPPGSPRCPCRPRTRPARPSTAPAAGWRSRGRSGGRPRRRLPPPVSITRLSTLGLRNGLLLGADASTRLSTMKPIRWSSPQPSSASSTRPRAAAPSREVALQGAPEQRVLGPGLLGEAAVLLVRLELGPSDADLGQLGGQARASYRPPAVGAGPGWR